MNEELKTELMKLLAAVEDQPLTRSMVAGMHMKLMLYGVKHFPNLTQTELNEQVKQVIMPVIKPLL